jgi:hypothetical protein
MMSVIAFLAVTSRFISASSVSASRSVEASGSVVGAIVSGLGLSVIIGSSDSSCASVTVFCFCFQLSRDLCSLPSSV